MGAAAAPSSPAPRRTPPLPFDEAKRAFDKLVREKTAKGYSPGADGVRFEGTDLAGRKTTHQPQLLKPVEDVEAVVADPSFWAQEKFDGERVLIEKKGDAVTGINRRGLARCLPANVLASVAALPGDFVLDGELVGEMYHAFDLLQTGPYSARLKALLALVPTGFHVAPVATAKTATEKRKLLSDVAARSGEGVVFKRHDAPHAPGRPASGGSQLKHKLTASASCIVVAASKTKRSAALGLLLGEEVRNVGNVTVPPNQPMPPVDGIVEVQYLYAYPGGALFQPVLLGVRSDVPREECVAAQLKLKAAAQVPP